MDWNILPTFFKAPCPKKNPSPCFRPIFVHIMCFLCLFQIALFWGRADLSGLVFMSKWSIFVGLPLKFKLQCEKFQLGDNEFWDRPCPIFYKILSSSANLAFVVCFRLFPCLFLSLLDCFLICWPPSSLPVSKKAEMSFINKHLHKKVAILLTKYFLRLS